MRTDKDAYKALGWLVLLTVGSFLLIAVLEGSPGKVDPNRYMSLLLVLVVFMAPDLCRGFSQTNNTSGLTEKRRRFSTPVGLLSVVSVASFPDANVNVSDLPEYGYTIAVMLFVILAISLFDLITLYSRKNVVRKLLFIGFKTALFSAIFAIVLGFVEGLTEVQVFWLFMIVIGVTANVLTPDNNKLKVAIKRATPVARRVIRLIERMSFVSGITLIAALPFVDVEGNTLDKTLVVAVAILIVHWIFTRTRDERPDFQR